MRRSNTSRAVGPFAPGGAAPTPASAPSTTSHRRTLILSPPFTLLRRTRPRAPRASRPGRGRAPSTGGDAQAANPCYTPPRPALVSPARAATMAGSPVHPPEPRAMSPRCLLLPCALLPALALPAADAPKKPEPTLKLSLRTRVETFKGSGAWDEVTVVKELTGR